MSEPRAAHDLVANDAVASVFSPEPPDSWRIMTRGGRAWHRPVLADADPPFELVIHQMTYARIHMAPDLFAEAVDPQTFHRALMAEVKGAAFDMANFYEDTATRLREAIGHA